MNTTYRTPQQQLWEHLTESQRVRFSQILKRIMQTLFLGLIDLLENRSKKAKSNNSKNNEA